MKNKSTTDEWWNEPDPVKALDGYLERKNPLYFQNQIRSVKKLIPHPSSEEKKALDYGCGGGAITIQLAKSGYKVHAVDSSPCSTGACREYVKREQLSDRVEIREVAPPDYWAGLPNDFDLIVAKDVIEHIEDDKGFMASAADHLAVGGKIIIVTQNSHSWNYKLEAPRQMMENPNWCGWHPTEHIRFYNKDILSSMLLETGLKPLKWRATYLIPYLEFKKGLSRRFKNMLHKIGMEKAFYWPEMIIGGTRPFNTCGWSIQVIAKKS